MNYPRQLNLDPIVEDNLRIWFQSELTNHFGERTGWIQKINDQQRDYNAEPGTEEVTFPFVGAANLIIPLIAIAFEATHSRTMQRFRALKQHIAVDIYDPDVEEIDTELETYLDQEIFVSGRFIETIEPAIIELEKLGTGVGQATYECITKKGFRTSKSGKEESFYVIMRKGPTIEATPLTSFLMPFDCLDPQTARWCGEVFWTTPGEVPQFEKDGLFREGTTEELRAFYSIGQVPSTPALTTVQNMEKLEDRVPSWPMRLEFYKIFCEWCVDPENPRDWQSANALPDEGDELREICFIYHWDSQKIVSINYNWFEDLRRPYRYANYFPVEFRWAGVGIAKQTEAFQKEITTQHRQTIDSGTIANTRMWKAKRNATDIKEGEPIFPNKIWFVDEMDDIQAFNNNEIYPSAYNNENQAMIYAQQRNGVNEITLGMPGVGTPGTATDSMNRVQESGRKNDYIYSNIKGFADQLLQDAVCNIVQWGPNIDRLRYSPMGPEIELFFKRPYEDFRKNLICYVQLINQNSNRMLDRQDATQLTGIVQQYYTQVIPLVQQLADPNASPELQAALRVAIKGANQIFSHVLSSFDQRDPKKYLIQIPDAITAPPQSLNGSGLLGASNAPPSSTVANVSVNAPNLQNVLPPEIAGLLGGRTSQAPSGY